MPTVSSETDPISIHALLAESDLSGSPRRTGRQRFLSTLSLRRATKTAGRLPGSGRISIHALLAESDGNALKIGPKAGKFLSTLSLRRATPLTTRHISPPTFLSTLSLRRATCYAVFYHFGDTFLSTLSLRRATNTGQPVRGLPSYFYPRSPCGERQHLLII